MKSSLLIFVIHLTKMTFPLLMLSSLFLWICELTKNRLSGWKCYSWVQELTKNSLCGWKCHKWLLSLTLLIHWRQCF
jgi:hypothetical protein